MQTIPYFCTMGPAEHEYRKLEKKLRSAVWNAMKDYHLIESGDKVMVCLSGGKDSYTMLDILMHYQKSSALSFEIIAVNLDQKQPGYPEEVLPNYLKSIEVPYKIIQKDTYSIVKEKLPEGATMCSLCSRLRRGALYAAATDLGITKIALGHHREDIIETMFLNMFFAGRLEAMPVKYKTDNQEHIVIRPLAYCAEKDIEQFSKLKNFPIIPCNLCGSQKGLQRQVIKEMLINWDAEFPGRSEKIFKAIRNTAPSHLLDKNLFDFEHLKPKLIPENNEFVID